MVRPTTKGCNKAYSNVCNKAYCKVCNDKIKCPTCPKKMCYNHTVDRKDIFLNVLFKQYISEQAYNYKKKHINGIC